MRDLAILLIHLLATIVALLRPGGARSLLAESLLLRQQLLILNRGRERAPNVKPLDRLIGAVCCGLIDSDDSGASPSRLNPRRYWRFTAHS